MLSSNFITLAPLYILFKYLIFYYKCLYCIYLLVALYMRILKKNGARKKSIIKCTVVYVCWLYRKEEEKHNKQSKIHFLFKFKYFLTYITYTHHPHTLFYRILDTQNTHTHIQRNNMNLCILSYTNISLYNIQMKKNQIYFSIYPNPTKKKKPSRSFSFFFLFFFFTLVWKTRSKYITCVYV